jgi:hypothetical protein
LLLCVALLLESLLLGQTRWPRSLYALDPPPIYAALGGSGALLELPFDNARPPFSQEPARSYNRWQPSHGRSVSENYEGPDAILAANRLAAAADALCGLQPTRPPHELPPTRMRDPAPLEDPAERARAVAGLRDAGFAWVILHRDRARSPERAAALLDRALGAPSIERGSALAWDLGAEESIYESSNAISDP